MHTALTFALAKRASGLLDQISDLPLNVSKLPQSDLTANLLGIIRKPGYRPVFACTVLKSQVDT